MLRVPDCERLELSFSEVVYIDTSGVAVLVEVLKSARHLGKKLDLSGLHDSPRYLFESTGLLSFFEEAPAPSEPMNISMLDQVGHSTLGYLEYIGGLVIQSGKTIGHSQKRCR